MHAIECEIDFGIKLDTTEKQLSSWFGVFALERVLFFSVQCGLKRYSKPSPTSLVCLNKNFIFQFGFVHVLLSVV